MDSEEFKNCAQFINKVETIPLNIRKTTIYAMKIILAHNEGRNTLRVSDEISKFTSKYIFFKVL